MATIDHLAALGDDGTALAAAARRGLDPPVPAGLAADGVDEALAVFPAPYLEDRPVGGHGDSLVPRVRELAAEATQ